MPVSRNRSRSRASDLDAITARRARVRRSLVLLLHGFAEDELLAGEGQASADMGIAPIAPSSEGYRPATGTAANSRIT